MGRKTIRDIPITQIYLQQLVFKLNSYSTFFCIGKIMKPFATLCIAALTGIMAAYVTVKITTPHATATTGTNTESAYARVMRTGIIRCGYGISPPVLVKDVNTGKVSGIAFDMWEQIGKQLGLKIEWAEEAGWGNFIEGLRTHRYDAWCTGMWPDQARSKFLTLSLPTVYSLLGTYVRTDDHRFDTAGLDSFNDGKVTIPAIDGDVSVTLAQNRFPNAKILTLPQTNTVSDMFLSVMTKKADVIFVDQAMFVTLEKENHGALRKIDNLPPAFVFASRYGYNHGEFALRDMVDIALRGMIDDGTIEKIAHRYSADYIPASKNYQP